MFTNEVSEKLKFYVYRLIDPRNGETFYVGKGKDNRVFQHVAGEIGSGLDDRSEKLRRIHEIRLAGLKTAHIIHRHGMDEKTAIEVEAALIDAFPGVTNIASGHNANDRGIMHAEEIIARFQAPIIDFMHRIVVININRTALERSVYEAVRYAWKVNPKRAEKAHYVLAVTQGLIVGVFEAKKWLRATPENFPATDSVREGRWGFEGKEAPKEILEHYNYKRLPDTLRPKGAANPIRYIDC